MIIPLTLPFTHCLYNNLYNFFYLLANFMDLRTHSLNSIHYVWNKIKAATINLFIKFYRNFKFDLQASYCKSY